jgi:hypothetical protein
MNALLKTVRYRGYPERNRYFHPPWKRSDYITLVIFSLVAALLYGFWPDISEWFLDWLRPH